MTQKADDTKESILACAKEEFSLKGFMDASLRSIAERAGLTTGAIYRYFEDKDSLFGALVAPLAQRLNEGFANEVALYCRLLNEGRPFDSLMEIMLDGIPAIVDFIYADYDTMRLLACRCAGSSFERYFDELAQRDAEETRHFIEIAYAGRQGKPNIDSAHMDILMRLTYKAVLEIVALEMPRDEADRYILVLSEFIQAGWGRILGGHPQSYADLH
ncbi:MAG: TetR/AcrR family transcriptional regulator [Clostridiales bacterium]|jgi:AcrR family transcriptional regulator|nr:TetR/AcrR family transcriptional regulator [Clostridiales bacterium]